MRSLSLIIHLTPSFLSRYPIWSSMLPNVCKKQLMIDYPLISLTNLIAWIVHHQRGVRTSFWISSTTMGFPSIWTFWYVLVYISASIDSKHSAGDGSLENRLALKDSPLWTYFQAFGRFFRRFSLCILENEGIRRVLCFARKLAVMKLCPSAFSVFACSSS